jgi:dolichyl-phosphate-mannose-protein mannosyltransferase
LSSFVEIFCIFAAAMARPTKTAPAKVSRAPPPQSIIKKHDDYTSDGVEDTDVFLLPGTDYQVMIGVTIVAAIIRLFRIYQPSSVVFDEVQCVCYGHSRSSKLTCVFR